jgi:predicted MFS family arabinose efflux permease
MTTGPSCLGVTVISVVGMSEISPLGSRRWWALVAVVLAVLAVSMDLTVLSVALPTLSGALKASETDLQWFSPGYALVLAAAMLPAGLLGDLLGRKKVMLWSLGILALGSLACAESRRLSTSPCSGPGRSPGASCSTPC